jgi:hypothetical protein
LALIGSFLSTEIATADRLLAFVALGFIEPAVEREGAEATLDDQRRGAALLRPT